MRRAASGIRRVGVAAAVALIATTVGITGTPATVSAAGTPLSTGLNADGQLGNGTTASRRTPGAVAISGSITQVASGREHAYALDSSGKIWAWGDNSKGQVGDGTSQDRPTPVQVAITDRPWIQVEAGHYHGIALRSDGTVWTWGYGTLGQLGLGTTNNRRAPVLVDALRGITIKAVAAGRDMSYAVASDGTVWGWGLNSFGEVGDGTTTQRLAPVRVPDLSGVVEIAGGRNHALVIRTDGSVWAWGANDYGQLGDGSRVNSRSPKQILASGARHVDAGADHSLAVMTTGVVQAWGRNQRGQVGVGGSSTVVPSPRRVPNLPIIVEVGDGRDSSFAMDGNGKVFAWGYNDVGQLGDGTLTTRRTPVALGLTGIGSAQGGRGHTIFLPR